MFVKYPMQDAKDYRGNVTLVVRNGDGVEIAYSAVESLDVDMVELVPEEVELVKIKARGDGKPNSPTAFGPHKDPSSR